MLCRGAPCCLEAGIGCPRQALPGKLWLPQALALAATGTGCPRLLDALAAPGKHWLPHVFTLSLLFHHGGSSGVLDLLLSSSSRGRDPLLPIRERSLGLFGSNATFEDADLLARFCFRAVRWRSDILT